MQMSGFLKTVLVVMYLLPTVSSAQFEKAIAKIGENAPPLNLTKVIQGPDIADLNWEKLKGKLVVIEFWNIGCKPCIQAIPHLNDLVEKFNGKPVAFLSISDNDEDVLRPFLKKTPSKTWQALDKPSNTTEKAFELKGYGIVVIVDMAGRIVGVTLPEILEAKHLERVLAGKSIALPILRHPNGTSQTNGFPATVHVSIESE
jgi:thiol-disulfide isomerase/thioredoxin